jgi:hypothetical protein
VFRIRTTDSLDVAIGGENQSLPLAVVEDGGFY